MGKNLTKHNHNTREVLFEKYERYYYQIQRTAKGYGLAGLRTSGGVCLEECRITRVRIGSGVCQLCPNNRAFDREKHFVICSKIKEAILQND